MAYDPMKTLALVKGGLLDPQGNWQAYLAETPDWKTTALQLTGPLLLANVVLATLFTWMVGGPGRLALGGNLFGALLFTAVTAIAGFLLAVVIVNALAGVFGGKPRFDRAFAAVSLAAIPAWLAGIVGSLIPWVGFLVSLAGGIWSLVLLYRVIPLALEVPEEKRVVHFIATLVATIACNVVLGAMLAFGGLRPGPAVDRPGFGDSRSDSDRTSIPADLSSGTGLFGQAQRQAELMEAAAQDRYEPPADGKVSKQQVRYLVEVLEKTAAAQADRTARLEKAASELEDDEVNSPADLVSVYQGMGAVVGLQNLEMDVVKSGGGNWAEYRWVKEQLRVAKLQGGSGSKTIEHNYALYRDNEDVLGDVL